MSSQSLPAAMLATASSPWPARGLRLALAPLVLACATLAACGGSDDDDTPQAPAATPWTLTVLHINDHHSNLDGKSKALKLKAGGADAATVNVSAGGFARVTQAMEDLAKTSPNVLKLHAGDAMTGTLYFNRAGADGEADAALMNTVCFDAFTLGNHEFDKGDAGLKGFLDRLHQGACKTPVLSANVSFGASSALHPSKTGGLVKRSIVVERGGHKVGIFGLTIAYKTKTASSPDRDTNFEDEAAAAQREIDALKAQGVKSIIGLTHIGYGLDKEVIARLSGIDAVIGGDSHTLLGPDSMARYGVGSPGGAYPTVLKDKDGRTVCLAQAWEYSQVVGELKINFDAEGNVSGCAGTPHVLIDDNFTVGNQPATEAQRTAILADVQASGFLRVTKENAAAKAVFQPFKQKIQVFNETVVAAVEGEEICSRRVPGGPGSADYSRSSAACNALGSVSVRGGDIQQIAAQAYLEVANRVYGGADISLQSGGGVRVPLLPGEITAAKVIEVLPFGNMLYRLDITGTEVKGMLEDGMEAVYGANGSTGPYPYTGGLRFDVDARQPRGQRVSNVEVRDAATGAWAPLDASRTYKLFVLSFNANGGDGYQTLAGVPAARRLDIGVLDSDVFFNYIESLPTRNAAGRPVIGKLPVDLYSTRSFTGPAAP